jgi:hypothetical protein
MSSSNSKVFEVVVSHEDRSRSEAAMAALRFTPPRQLNAAANGGGEACLARAYVMPGRMALRLTFPACRVVKVRGQTLHVRTSRTALDLLMMLDERVTEVAKSSVDAWFLHRMDPDLVEEYYRGNSAIDSRHGIVARFVVDAQLQQQLDDAPLDLTMQFHGVQFRRQYFTAVWKLIKAVPAAPSSALGDDDFFRGDADRTDDEDEEVGPNAEECAEMRQALMARLLEEESVRIDALERVQELVRVLEASPVSDVRTLEDVERLLGVFFSRE